MLSSFISLEFLFFFTGLFSIFIACGKEYRVGVLFMGSLLFIGLIHPVFLFYGLLYSLVNYLAGLVVASDKIRFREFFYYASQTFNLGFLFFFKYMTVVLTDYVKGGFGDIFLFLLPLGISYYSFQSISYLYLVKKGAEQAEKSYVHFGLYMLFFPKFIAGPIERSRSFLPQLNGSLEVDYDGVVQGVRLFMWGAFKKVVIANTLGIIVNKVYGTPSDYSALAICLALVLQSSYLYCDFSGYTDMALGLSRMLGLRLSPNFNNPLGAQTVGEFWRKWHISLSSWCNDFIYNRIMLRYRRHGKRAAFWGITATFLIIGIWHGANLTYLVLGLLQAAAIIYEFFSKPYRVKLSARINPKGYRIFSILLVNLFFSFSLVFFFSKDLESAFGLLSRLFSTPFSFEDGFGYNLNRFEFFIAMFSLLLVYFVEYSGWRLNLLKTVQSIVLIRHSLYMLWLLLVVFFSRYQNVFTYAGF